MTYDIWIESRDGSRKSYRHEGDGDHPSQMAVGKAMADHTAATGEVFDGEQCWVRQILGVADSPETQTDDRSSFS